MSRARHLLLRPRVTAFALLIPLLARASDPPRTAVCQAATSPDRLIHSGLEFSRKEQYAAAADCYRKALTKDPKLLPAQLNLGLAEFKLGHFSKAVIPFQAALELAPSSFQAQKLLGMSYYGDGRYGEAAATIAPAVASQPDNASLRYVLAQSCLWAGRYDDAQKQFEWLLRKDPNSAEAHILLGEALDGLRRTDEAIAEFQAAAQSGETRRNLLPPARIFYQHGTGRRYRCRSAAPMDATRDRIDSSPAISAASISRALARTRPLFDIALPPDPGTRPHAPDSAAPGGSRCAPRFHPRAAASY
jgi:tetratricopeptide (TPR) repeat protein